MKYHLTGASILLVMALGCEGTSETSAEVTTYEEAKSELIGKSPDEVRDRCGEPAEISHADTATYGPDATEEEKHEFMQSAVTKIFHYEGFYAVFNAYDKVMKVEAE